jgi:tetratricopeptide (TPR) repeat protein
MLGECEEALSYTAKAFDAMGKDFDLRTYTFTHIAACAAYGILGRWDESVEEGGKALTAGQEFSDRIATSLAAFHLAIPYANKGDLTRAVEYGELAIQMALTPLDKAQAQGSLAWIWCRSGEPTKGIEVLAPLVEIAPDSGSVPVLIMCTQALGEGYYLAGEHGKARQTLKGLLDLSQRCGAKYHGGVAYRLLGEVNLKSNPDEAPPLLDKAISIFQKIKAENELALAYSGMGRYHRQQGNTEQAREYLTKALEIFESLGTLIEPDNVRKELAELSHQERCFGGIYCGFRSRRKHQFRP